MQTQPARGEVGVGWGRSNQCRAELGCLGQTQPAWGRGELRHEAGRAQLMQFSRRHHCGERGSALEKHFSCPRYPALERGRPTPLQS